MLQLVAQQFENTLVRILLAAGAISFVLALFSSAGALMILPFVEALVIFLILVANAAVGVWQETNAEKALEALRQIQSDHAAVLRDAEWEPALPVRDLVPGDVVMVRVGDKVPADMRVLRLVLSTLRVEQGSLTGETNSVNKTAHAVPADDADIQAKDCMVFAGTTVVNGSAVCLVVHTGMATEIGKIHSQIHEALQEDDDTPLKKKLNEFGETLTNIIGLICILVWLIKVILGVDRLDMIKGFLQKVLAFEKFLEENEELDSEYKVVLLHIAVPTRSDVPECGGTSLDAVAAAIQALEEKFKLIRANDDAIVLDALSFSTPKIRLLHSLTVEKKNSVQILVEVTTYANGSLDGLKNMVVSSTGPPGLRKLKCKALKPIV
ncbi:calcium-transporting ATPase 4, endoplasmic reticulum-type-like [Hordeum vulgare]|nr:calcium-transporting ATPase 4, endoplasmic reticulum-type-like [Hordeum vulgare]